MISFILLEAKSVRYVSCVNLCMAMTPVSIPMHLADSETTIFSPLLRVLAEKQLSSRHF